MKSRALLVRKSASVFVPKSQESLFWTNNRVPVLGLWTTTLGERIRQWNGGLLSTENIREEAPTPTLNGTWVFDAKRSDSPDEQLRALGLPWWKRIVARQARPVISIQHDREKWKQSITFPVLGSFYELNESLELNGTPQQSKLHGFDILQRSQNEGQDVVTKTLVDGKHSGEIRRRLIEEGRTYFVTSTLRTAEGRTVVKKTYFNRRSA